MRFPVQIGRGSIAKEWSWIVGKAGGKSAIGCCFRLFCFCCFTALLNMYEAGSVYRTDTKVDD